MTRKKITSHKITLRRLTLRRLTLGIAACFWAACSLNGASVHGQADFIEHDLQFFSPVDFDFEDRPIRKSSGLFFRYDKLSWAMTGERTTIGDNSLNVQSEAVLVQTPFSEGIAPPTYAILNSIQDAPPASDFAWGERYEFGLQSNGNGWLIGVLDGPAVQTTEIYGFNELAIPGTLPLLTRDNPDIDPGITPFLTLGPNDLSQTRNGFGSVHVNFATPTGFLSGFRDYSINGVNNQGGPTIRGPGRTLLPGTVVSTIINGLLTQVQITAATVITGADGIPDDLDGDGITFFTVFTDDDGDGVFDDFAGNGIDYNDLYTFNVAFDTFIVRNYTETQGIELMRTVDLSNRFKQKKDQRNSASIAFGARYLRLRDEFYWEGRGSILGLTYANTEVQNSIIGPQIRGKWHTQRGRWGIDIDGRFVWGYNVQDQDQFGAIGQDLVPGGVNSLATARPNAVRSGRHNENFSPLAELRAEASYNLTSSIALRLGYTAMFLDNITRASQTQVWALPNLGLSKGGKQDIFINGVNVGFDVVY